MDERINKMWYIYCVTYKYWLTGRKMASVELFMSHSEKRTNRTHWVGRSEGAPLMDWLWQGTVIGGERLGSGGSVGEGLGPEVGRVGGKGLEETWDNEARASFTCAQLGPLLRNTSPGNSDRLGQNPHDFVCWWFLPLMGFSAKPQGCLLGWVRRS